jgi:hypothetical protein
MGEIADSMQDLLQKKLAELDASVAAELESHRGALAELDDELAPFHGRTLSQENMVRFQAILSKRNQAYQMMGQLFQKRHQAMNSIIANMR